MNGSVQYEVSMNDEGMKELRMKELLSRDTEDTDRFAVELAGSLKMGDTVAFTGELGTGKTLIIQKMCKALGVDELVTSPTFTLMNIYSGSYKILHLDCYRIQSVSEAQMLGLDEYFNTEYITLIEWAEKIGPLLPDSAKHVRITHVPENPAWRKIYSSAQ